MRLSEYTDYTLRVLIYCAEHPDRLVTVSEVTEYHQLSRSHLTKIVNALARQGWIQTVRGRGGGLRLLRDPETIRIGDVVRASENDFRLVECFDARGNTCTLNPGCRLKRTLIKAMLAFHAELDRCTLADVVRPPRDPSTPPATPATPVAIPVRLSTPASRKRAAGAERGG